MAVLSNDWKFAVSIIYLPPPAASTDFLKTLVPPLQLRKAGETRHVGGQKLGKSLSICVALSSFIFF